MSQKNCFEFCLLTQKFEGERERERKREKERMLAGKRCVVSGATSGIGMAVAKHFVKEGARVAATGRNQDVLHELQKELGSNCSIIVGDISKDGEPQKVIEEAADIMGGSLTTLINCAGVLQPAAFGSDALSLENYHFNFRTNTQAVFEMMMHATSFLKKASEENNHRGVSITNVSSVNGKQSFGGVGTYCASKAATDMLTRCAAIDLAPFGIRVNAVNPGVVITNLQKRGGLDDEKYEGLIQRSIEVTHPLYSALQECPQPIDVANLIAFLSSEQAAFITGDCIAIDGGRACLGAR